MYEIFEHTADLGLRVTAADLPSLMAEAGRGLFSMMVANLDQVRPLQEKQVRLSAEQYDYLLFDWLNELLYIFETERLLLAHFDVRVEAMELSATCRGEPMDPQRHDMDHEVKAVTYHGLTVEQSSGGWLAEVIVDI